jgi:hypothetical protein
MATTHQVAIFYHAEQPLSKEVKTEYNKLKYCAECCDEYIFFDLEAATDTTINKFLTEFNELSGLDNPTIQYNIYQEAPEYTWDLIDSDEFINAFVNHFGNGYDIVCSDEFYVSGATRAEAKDKLKQVKTFVKEYIKNQKHNKLLKKLKQYA